MLGVCNYKGTLPLVPEEFCVGMLHLGKMDQSLPWLSMLVN